jgi:hypothetical protein
LALLQIREFVTQEKPVGGIGKGSVLSSTTFTNEIVDRMIEFETALKAKEQAEDQLTLFATIALVPPLIILELWAAVLWARRGFRACMNASRIDLLSAVSHLLQRLRPTGGI